MKSGKTKIILRELRSRFGYYSFDILGGAYADIGLAEPTVFYNFAMFKKAEIYLENQMNEPKVKKLFSLLDEMKNLNANAPTRLIG